VHKTASRLLGDYNHHTLCGITNAVSYNLYSWRCAYKCSKHVELIYENKLHWSHQLGSSRHCSIRCTVTHTSNTLKLYYHRRRLRRYHHHQQQQQLSMQKLTFCEMHTSYTSKHFRNADSTFYIDTHFISATVLFRDCDKRLLASTHPSVCRSGPYGTTRLPRDGFARNLIFQYFSKICRENGSFVKIWQEQHYGILHEDRYTLSIICCSLPRMKNISDKSCREIGHIVSTTFILWKSCHIFDNVGKCCTEGYATDDYKARALCMLDT
jgi:hypothetical protein